METGWDVVFTESFRRDFQCLPSNVGPRIEHHLELLRVDPFAANPNAKRLKNQKLSRGFRLRLGDYRLLYRVPSDSNKVILVSVGKRGAVYRKPIGSSPIHGDASELFLREQKAKPVTVREVEPTQAVMEAQVSTPEPQLQPVIEEFLIDADELDLIRVPVEYHDKILASNNISELEGSDLPKGVVSRLADYLTNPSQTHIGRLYSLESGDDFTAVAERPLREFMLAPDPQQRTVIDKDLKGGPILARGGPGTGKTLIGLYRLKRILAERATESLFDEKKPIFAFLSYTNSLVNTSEELFRSLFSKQSDIEVRFSTLDSIVASQLAAYYRQKGESLGDPPSAGTLDFRLQKMTLNKMLEHEDPSQNDAATYVKEKLGVGFLAEEITDVIEANDIKTSDDYLAFQRKGRKMALQRPARQAIWAVYENFRGVCEQGRRYTWAGRRQKYLHLLENGELTAGFIDSLVLDEAQDMSVVALRIVTRLVRDSRFLLLLADSGQSIYNKAPTWKNVSSSLRFHRGNSVILSKSYRMTQQLSRALQPLRNDADVDGDDPIQATSGVFSGEKPVWMDVPADKQDAAMTGIVCDLVKNKGINAGQIAVIQRSVKGGENGRCTVANDLLNAGLAVDIFDKKRPVDVYGSAVHIINAHSAKGLEFPFVIVSSVSDETYPFDRSRPNTNDEKNIEEWIAEEQRLFYVALSRASYRTWMITDSEQPSRFLSDLDPADWEKAAYEG